MENYQKTKQQLKEQFGTLNGLTSKEAEEKLNMIELEYQIPVSEELREEVNLMCNLSDGIEERAAEKAAEKTLRETNKKVITNMHRKGYTLEQIAEIVEIKPEEVGKIIEEESMSV